MTRFGRMIAAVALTAGLALGAGPIGVKEVQAQDSTLLGTGVGGAAGAGIGYGLGGAKGAAVGGILGLGVGALSGHLYGKKDNPPPAQTYYAPPPQQAPAYQPAPPYQPAPAYQPAQPVYDAQQPQAYAPPPPAYQPAYQPAPGAPAVAGAGYDTSYCRQYTKNTNIGGQNYTSTGTACRQPDGTWREVN